MKSYWLINNDYKQTYVLDTTLIVLYLMFTSENKRIIILKIRKWRI